MKRCLLVLVILLVAGSIAYTQTQSQAVVGPTAMSSAQVTQNAQQLLSQGRTNLTEYESILAQLTAANLGNSDAETYRRLRGEMERIELLIKAEEERVTSILNGGSRVSVELLNRIERLIGQHRVHLAELEAFVNR